MNGNLAVSQSRDLPEAPEKWLMSWWSRAFKIKTFGVSGPSKLKLSETFIAQRDILYTFDQETRFQCQYNTTDCLYP